MKPYTIIYIRRIWCFSVCMKYIDSAMERLKTKQKANDDDLSLLERILVNEPDPKTAYVLALDLILVGIDTVSLVLITINWDL